MLPDSTISPQQASSPFLEIGSGEEVRVPRHWDKVPCRGDVQRHMDQSEKDIINHLWFCRTMEMDPHMQHTQLNTGNMHTYIFYKYIEVGPYQGVGHLE